ncbi:hypothetical protein [Afipia felis]|uniref:Uncharacterized protein n=2 Tax=Afipia felis TaxID=1035 RepID=A0A380W9S3_AFIFE|nr:hypothetical protein [Afipia felis]EKS28081.1 hypothetical protein HMPREF9697_00609 [Afipia felis ATCC 53690]SUU76791.1 Uncharacterised protein [Afipia felis]SUU84857.1 Uncharacterised protein [Afipia felis]
MKIPKIKPPPHDEPARPWGEASGVEPKAPVSQVPGRRARRFGRSWLSSILFAVLIFGLWGGRAWQDLSSPSAWAYWKDRYFSPTLTSSVIQIEANGRSHRALAISGEIGAAAAVWFREKLDDAKLGEGDFVVLSSPGGQVDQALIMGDVIRSRGLTTMVAKADATGRLRPSYCASACVLVYAGGKIREAFPGSALGVHQFTTELPRSADFGRDIVADTQKTTGIILDYMTRMGVSPSILQAMSATRDIRWLNDRETFDLKLATNRFAG